MGSFQSRCRAGGGINHGDTEITERATSKGLTRPRRLGKPLGDRGGSRERLHKQPCKGEQLKTANQTSAGSPIGQDEREANESTRGDVEGQSRLFFLFAVKRGVRDFLTGLQDF